MKKIVLFTSLLCSTIFIACGSSSSSTPPKKSGEGTYNTEEYLFAPEVLNGTKVYKNNMRTGFTTKEDYSDLFILSVYSAYKKDGNDINFYLSDDRFIDDGDIETVITINKNEISEVPVVSGGSVKEIYPKSFKIGDTFSKTNDVTCVASKYFDSIDVIPLLNKKLPQNQKISNVSKIYKDVIEVKCSGLDNGDTVDGVSYYAKGKNVVAAYQNSQNYLQARNDTFFSYTISDELSDEL